MAATNEAFHWAGLVHLHRRVLGKPSTHPNVQEAVREIHGALYKVRRGGSATACLLFPIFTAGCDTQDEKQRADILERLKGVERFGMTQVLDESQYLPSYSNKSVRYTKHARLWREHGKLADLGKRLSLENSSVEQLL